MIFKNQKIQKTISALMIIAILVPSFAILSAPKKTEAAGFPVFDVIGDGFTGTTAASTTVNTAISVKNVLKEVANQLLMAVARKALASMTKSTVAWINNGFHGAPLFVQNPDSFFKDITKFEIKDLISIVGYDSIRFPFGKQFALNTIDAYKSQLDINAAYSLSTVVNDPMLLTNYRTNFGVGGWTGFMLNTQYPQNNFIGSQIQLNNELALRLDGTSQTAAQKVNTVLQQGMGFLSTQTCPSNPAYNNLISEYNRPSFKFDEEWDPPAVPNIQQGSLMVPDPTAVAAYNSYETAYKMRKQVAQSAWGEKNTCPGGLVTTTPGSVVASTITKSLGLPQDSLLTGSLSAIFDALTNKFLGSGLNSLASSANSQPYDSDTWDYYGNTLGSPSVSINGNVDPFSGPDQEIILRVFKSAISGKTVVKDSTGAIVSEKIGNKEVLVNGTKVWDVNNGMYDDTIVDTGNGVYIPGDIANTKEELRLMDNPDPNNYGVIQLLGLIWPKARELDICVPGPNLGWEDRLSTEKDRNNQMIQSSLPQDTTAENSYEVSLASKNLAFAVNFFKDWIKNQMLKPVDKGGLGLPDSGAFLDAVNNITNINQQFSQLVDNKNAKNQALLRLQSIENSLKSITTQPLAGSSDEKALISFRKQYDSISLSVSNAISIEDTRTQLSTAIDEYTNLSKLLGQCTVQRQAQNIGWSIPATGWTKSGGEDSNLFSAARKTFTIDYFWGNNRSGYNPLRRTTKVIKTTGNEKEQFCDLPIVSGYTHETFVNPQDPNPDTRNVPYPAIPLVNAGELSGLAPSDQFGRINLVPGFSGKYGPLQSVNMNLSCNIIYQSNVLDYKGDLPGATVVEPTRLPDVDTSSPTYNPKTDTTPTDTGGANNPGTTNPPPTDGTGTNPPSDDCGIDIPCG